MIWEPSRFAFTYALVRAYWRTGNERYTEAFWKLVENWHSQNPPNQGPNWQCGQEASLRVLAWCFGLYGFLGAGPTTACRVALFGQLMLASGRRIAGNLSYALSQRNNHGISEGLGLWTLGTLFPEMRDAARWEALGRRALERTAARLIYDDGAFAQHSLNYHRLMLHDYLWALRLADVVNQPFSAALSQRVARAGAFLYQLQDEITGQVPCYGQNDGALVLPLNNCDARDFRPVVQAIHFLATRQRCFESGPWDEDLLWLWGPAAPAAPVDESRRTDWGAPDGGYVTLRDSEGFLFTRAGKFRHRPSQADQLHVDLWWRGQNIALDPGTYSYNCAPWDTALSRTVSHNTVTVDDRDQMEQVGTFLWLPWITGRAVHSFPSQGGLAYWEGTHDGYRRLAAPVSYRRGIVRLGGGWWLVLDRLVSRASHDYRLHWLLADVPYVWQPDNRSLALESPAGRYHVQIGLWPAAGQASVVRAAARETRGWQAPYYQALLPAVSLALSVAGQAVLFWTLFGPEPARVEPGGRYA